MPGLGRSAENTRTETMADLTMAEAVASRGIDRFNLLGTSFGGKVALWLALLHPERVLGLVLEAPAAIRPAGSEPPSGSAEEMARRPYAHPELLGPLPGPDRGAGANAGTGGALAWARPGCGVGGADARAEKHDPGAVGYARPCDPTRDGPFL